MAARKLTPQDLEQFRLNLLRARGILTGDVEFLEREALEVSGTAKENREDARAESYFREFNLQLLERDENSLREIDAALERIAAGGYGICDVCEERITKARLRAMPHARTCVICQRRAESEGA